MKQEISALMDGELFEDEAEVLLSRVKQDPCLSKDWACYHLIGDVLRQPEHIHRDLSTVVQERLRDEPVVLAPRAAKQQLRAFAFSAAASLAAIGVVVWMSLQLNAEPVPQIAMQQPALGSGSMQVQPKSNAYLMAHQEFSPSMEANAGASYVRTVRAEEK